MAILLLLVTWLSLSSAQFIDDMQTFDPECLIEGAFMCFEGGCIPQEKYCDGRYDCKDASDENFCVNHLPDEQYCNETHQFLCGDGRKCIPTTWVCNELVECTDGSDEVNCTNIVDNGNSSCKGFLCDGGKKCISQYWMCDGYYDCADKSDEDIQNTCLHSLRSKSLHDVYVQDIPNCESRGRYTCEDKSYCLPMEYVCDGLNDCKNGSDEGKFCDTWHTMCNNFSCPQNSTCKPQRAGATCDCGHYKKYNPLSKHCEETNQCMEERPVCSHQCLDKRDHFLCMCDHGYTTDFASYLCFAPDPEAMLFYNTRNDIGYVKVKSKHQVVVATGIKQAHGVSYDGQYLYWVETAQGHQAIMRATLDNIDESKQVLAALGLEDPGDIAIDYLGDNIYFSDAERGVISVCRCDGSVCTTLRPNTRHPRFVTLDPRKGRMYWADWHDRPVIMHSNMDGSNAEVLVDHLGSFATGLDLDAPNGRLYFVDRTIKVVRLKDRKVYSFFEEPFHYPYTLAVFENTIYWSDWTSNTIQTTDKIHGTSFNRNILLKSDEAVFDMHIYHPVLMNKTINPCAKHDCGICLVTSNVSHVCACPDDMQMVGGHCEHIPGYRPQYLIVGAGSTFTRVRYNTIGNPETHGTHFNIGRVQAMAYDNIRDALYIYDSQHKSINHINMSDFTLGVTELVLYKGLENVIDMEYEFVSDSLYILDAGRRLIEALSLKSKETTLVYYFRDQEIPMSFCVMPEYGRMLVAILESEDNNAIHIDSIGLDGTDREHLLMNTVLGPNVRLRYSLDMNIVYIADDGNAVIETIHPEGTGKESFRNLMTTIASLSVTDTHVFWTDRRSSRLYWADIHEAVHKIRRIELSIFPNDTHLHILATSPLPDDKNPLRQHKCFQNTSPCSHICLQSPHPLEKTNASDMGYTCRCPPGYLTFDHCLKFVECKSNEFYCHKSVECIDGRKKCDGVKDCKDGEDEEGCQNPVTPNSAICPLDEINCHGVCIPKSDVCRDNKTSALLKCSSTEFRCADNSVCIDRSLLCEGHSDCVDSSDEHADACETFSCLPTEFRCTSGNCIPIPWKCDRSEDCADGSDEIGCDKDTCPQGSFQCDDGKCVEVFKRCDGKYDCVDHADEQDCETSEFFGETEHSTCTSLEYACEGNQTICLPLTARCNGKVDCPGGTDELGCDFHCGGQFLCKQEYRCIKNTHVCNGRKDCSDGSDETIEACIRANKTFPLRPVYIPSSCNSGYRCDNGQCVEWADVCDTRHDCLDASDEGGKCGTPCIEGTCQYTCHKSPRGPQCTCPHGYELHESTCRDVDECANRVCSHACHNVPESFVCSCHRGYSLRSDRRSCKALSGHFAIMYTKGIAVWSMNNHFHSVKYRDKNNWTLTDVDVDVRRNKAYVVASDAGKLFEVNLANKSSTVDVITNIGVPSKVATDWVSENVYFVDSTPSASYIRVCNFQRRRCARLQKLPSDSKVTAFVLDPYNHLMFYCISQSDEAVVRSATLAGKDVTDLSSVNSCSGLAADSFAKILYISSEEPSSIMQVNYDGNMMKTILKNDPNVQSPRNIALFEDYIYFLSNTHLNRCLLFGLKTCEVYDHVYNATYFAVRHESAQRDDVPNPCDEAVCSNICVLGSNGPQCVCHHGTISNNGTCSLVKSSELAMFNGWTYQEYKSHSVSYTLVSIAMLIFALYLCLFVYHHFFKKKSPSHYMQVRYQNTTDGTTQLPNPIIDMPDAAYIVGGTAHEFVNPLQFVRNYWQDSFYKKKPIGTAGLIFDTQQDLSDTESDLDVKENRRMNNIY